MVAGKAVTPKEHGDAEKLHRYWVAGPGLAKWSKDPHPWSKLRELLAKYIHDPHLLDHTTSRWHNEVMAPTGSDRYRVEHGGKMRGKRLGPG
ncbi:MAG: hypothetical protein JWO67_764 [Streptosporangiaceae bacterium]|nr:hypothetical protein [Streptosporangiaceae bacterium]